MKLRRKWVLFAAGLVALVAVVVGIVFLAAVMVNEGPDVMLDSLQAGAHRVQFYIDYPSWDSAVLGFFVKDQTGRPRYFPIYGSTYRGLPPVELEVFLSEAEEEMWVLSSWEGYEVLAYHQLGSDWFTDTRSSSKRAASDTPSPQGGRGVGPRMDFPDMDRARVKRVLTIKIPSRK